MQEIVNKFTTHLKNVFTRALSFVVENGYETVTPEHLLWALGTQRGCIAAELLGKAGVRPEDVRTLIESPSRGPTAGNVSFPGLSDVTRRIVEKAVLTASVCEHRYVGTEHLLSAILQMDLPSIHSFFASRNVDAEKLKQQIGTVLKSTSRFPEITGNLPQTSEEGENVGAPAIPKPSFPETEETEEQKTPALEYFAQEITTETAQQRIDPVIGREREIERVMQILCRRTKNNPILLGEPGVGKTAIVEGLAKKIVEGAVPSALRGKRIFSLDLAAVIAGTMYRGEFEGRLRQIVEEIRKHPEIILFIDEVHTIIGAGSAAGSLDAANILKPALARGEIRCIGATTASEFKKHFETDAALERRFCPVQVDEPNAERTQAILEGVRGKYETYHRVNISDEALEAAVTLSGRYIQDKRQPDKALDLIDEAASALNLKLTTHEPLSRRATAEKRLIDLRETKRRAVMEERFEEAVQLKEEERHLLAEVALLENEQGSEPLGSISAEDIADVVARMTGIPLTELVSEQKQLKKLEEALRRHVIGQDAATEAVARAVRRAKAGVADPRRPLASFLFLGPSGVGKTELARAVAREVFRDEKALVGLDMSEFAEAFSLSKLVGAPAGYVGYRENTKLTDRVKARPYAVVLFDELEKAHRDVSNVLLQILEQGELTDATGRPVNFKNTIVIMTSNVGAERFEKGSIGFAGSEEDRALVLTQDLRRELEEQFRPELLNRIDHIAIFQPLSPTSLIAIANKQLRELVERLGQDAISLTYDDTVADILVEGSRARASAREIRRRLQDEIESKVADHLLGTKRPIALHAARTKNGIVIKKG